MELYIPSGGINYLSLSDNATTNDTGLLDLPSEEILLLCINAESMHSLSQFYKCLSYYFFKSILVNVLVLAFCFFTALLNAIVIVFINRQKQFKTVFDKIFIGHAAVDMLVGLFIIPWYCIYFMFGYWPLGKFLCTVYVSLDYTICHVGILHMVYLAYARLRSLRSPKRYHQEAIISHSKFTMGVLWVVSCILWLPAINIIIQQNYTTRKCYPTFNPVFILAQNFLAYLLPMLTIIGITLYILNELYKNNKKRKELNRLRRSRRKSNSYVCNMSPVPSFQNVNLPLRSSGGTMSSNRGVMFEQRYLRTSESVNLMPQQHGEKKSIAALSIITMERPSIKLNDLFVNEQEMSTGNINANNRKKKKSSSTTTDKDEHEMSTTNSCSSRKSSEKSVLNRAGGRCFFCWYKRRLPHIKLNAFAKLYLIIITFCILWLPFCIVWPISSICEACVPEWISELSYWMGYGQSLVNPILLLILNPNYNKLKQIIK